MCFSSADAAFPGVSTTPPGPTTVVFVNAPRRAATAAALAGGNPDAVVFAPPPAVAEAVGAATAAVRETTGRVLSTTPPPFPDSSSEPSSESVPKVTIKPGSAGPAAIRFEPVRWPPKPVAPPRFVCTALAYGGGASPTSDASAPVRTAARLAPAGAEASMRLRWSVRKSSMLLIIAAAGSTRSDSGSTSAAAGVAPPMQDSGASWEPSDTTPCPSAPSSVWLARPASSDAATASFTKGPTDPWPSCDPILASEELAAGTTGTDSFVRLAEIADRATEDIPWSISPAGFDTTSVVPRPGFEGISDRKSCAAPAAAGGSISRTDGCADNCGS
mmetsp:Transcript_16812/g.35552  ORF Transcript_16812/g.35552 Transcript_16812/m.35552 type:complete len:331 (-) Transcript_16812:535-1527(-)